MRKSQLPSSSGEMIALSETGASIRICSDPKNDGLPHQSIDQRLHELGHASREHFEGLKSHYLELAICILEAKLLLTHNGGRSSGFPRWLADHLPAMERKTADRLASIAEAFAVNADNVSTFRQISDRFRLTALYRLAAPGVPEEARAAAIAAAQAGETIGVARATEIVEAFQVSEYQAVAVRHNRADRTSRTDTHTKTIDLPAGTVALSINHDDFARALREALHELGDDLGRGN